MNLKIVSLNVRGIGNTSKRREVFNWLRSKNFSIYMPQEAQCTENTRYIWTSEWGYKTLFSCCSSNKAVVGILFDNNFNLKILKAFVDLNGRFVICDIETNSKLLTLANVYAPNEDDQISFRLFLVTSPAFTVKKL